jgi:hypothetical protein
MSDLESRIATLESIEAIKSVKARYFFSCDNKRPADVRSCFADGDIDLQYGRIGNFTRADDMVAIFTELACEDHIVEMHHAQNPQISVTSTTQASALWGLYYFMIDTNQNVATQLGGFYEDEYRCIDGEWKITRSVFNQTSTQIMDVSEAVAKVIFAGRTAPVELDDPSRQAG